MKVVEIVPPSEAQSHILDFSSDDKHFFVAQANRVYVYNVEDGTREADHYFTLPFAYARQADLLAFGETDTDVCVVHAATGERIARWRFDSNDDDKFVRLLALSPEGDKLAVARSISRKSGDPEIIIVDVHTGGRSQPLAGSEDAITRVCMSSAGKLLAVGGERRTVLFDINHRTKLPIAPLAGEFPVFFSPDTKYLYCAGKHGGGTIRVHELPSGRLTVNAPAERIANPVFSQNNQLLAAAVQDYSIRVWNARSGRQILKIDLGDDYAPARAVAFVASDTLLASAHYGEVRFWSVERGERESARSLEMEPARAPLPRKASRNPRLPPNSWFPAVENLTASADGKRLAFAYGRAVYVYDVARREIQYKATMPGVADSRRILLSIDGRLLADAYSRRPEGIVEVRVTDVETGKEIGWLPPGLVHSPVAFVDERRILVERPSREHRQDAELVLVDIGRENTFEEPLLCGEQVLARAVLDSNGDTLLKMIARSDDRLRQVVWSYKRKSELFTAEHPAPPMPLSLLSPDGSLFVTGDPWAKSLLVFPSDEQFAKSINRAPN